MGMLFLLQRRGRQDTTDGELSEEREDVDEPDNAGPVLEEIDETADDDDEEQVEDHMPKPSGEKKIKRKRVQRQERMPVGYLLHFK